MGKSTYDVRFPELMLTLRVMTSRLVTSALILSEASRPAQRYLCTRKDNNGPMSENLFVGPMQMSDCDVQYRRCSTNLQKHR